MHGLLILNFTFYTAIFLQEKKKKEKIDDTQYQVKKYIQH